MAEFTKIGLIFHPDTREIIRIVYPTEGDHELDDMSQHLFALDEAVPWQWKIVGRDGAADWFWHGDRLMAITVTNINTQVTTSGSAVTITAVTVPAGACIIMCWGDSNTVGSSPTFGDTHNTYVLAKSQNVDNTNADGMCGVHYVANATALSSGTITCTPATSGGGTYSAFYATGVALSSPLDTTVTASAFGSSTSPSVTAANAPAVANSLILGFVGVDGAIVTFTQDSAHAAYATPPTKQSNSGSPNAGLVGGTVVSSSKLTYAPTIGNHPWTAIILGFSPSIVTPSITGVVALGLAGYHTAQPGDPSWTVTGTWFTDNASPSGQPRIYTTGNPATTYIQATFTGDELDVTVESSTGWSNLGIYAADNATLLDTVTGNTTGGTLVTTKLTGFGLGSHTIFIKKLANDGLFIVLAMLAWPQFLPSVSTGTISGVSSGGSAGSVSPLIGVIPFRAGIADDSIAEMAIAADDLAIGVVGVSATGSAGTVIANVQPSATGVSAAGSAGGPTAQVASPISGVSASGSAGTVTVSDSAAISGAAATGSAGIGSVSHRSVLRLPRRVTNGFTPIGTASGKAVSSLVITLPATGAAGSVAIEVDASVSISGVSATGSAGSVQTIWQDQAGGRQYRQASANTTTALAVGHWLVCRERRQRHLRLSAPSGTLTMAASAFYALGIYAAANPFDVSGGVAGFGTQPALDVGSPVPTYAGELVVATLATDGPSTDSFTQDSNYTSFTRVGTTGGSDVTIAGGALINTGLGYNTYAPHTTTSRDCALYIANFRGIPMGVSATGLAGAVTTSTASVTSVAITGVSATGSTGSGTSREIHSASSRAPCYGFCGAAAVGKPASVPSGAVATAATSSLIEPRWTGAP